MGVLIGTVIVMTATVLVSISTDSDSCYICLHRVLLGVSYKDVFIFTAFNLIFSLLEIILSIMVLMITIFDLRFSDIVSRFFVKNFNRNVRFLSAVAKTQKRSDIF